MTKIYLLLSTLISCFVAFKSANPQVTYQDIADSLELYHVYPTGFYSGGVAFHDFDGDGWDDLTLASPNGDSIRFYKNMGGSFQKISLLQTDPLAESKQILWADYDNDGDKDLFVTHFLAENKLYQNDGNMNFTDVTAAAGLVTPDRATFGACFGDYDKDGWLDLYIVNYSLGLSNPIPQRNFLFRNVGNGTFEETTLVAGVADSNRTPFIAAFLDYNNDTWPDIFVPSDKHKGSSLYENQGDGTFINVSDSANSNVLIDAMTVTVGDYDNNDYLDIYITSTHTGNSLTHNNGDGTFSEMAGPAGVSFDAISWSANWLDYDFDGDLDLYVCGDNYGQLGGASVFYENQGNGTFTTPNVGFIGDTLRNFSSAVGDIQNDGYPDIAVGVYHGPNMKLWNSSANGTNNWIKIGLEGVMSNRDGIGSVIEVYANGMKQKRYTMCGSDFLTQNSSYEFVGVGTANVIDSINILWPSGHKDHFENIGVNKTIKIVEALTSKPNPVIATTVYPHCNGDSVILDAGQYDHYQWSTGEVTRTISVTTNGNYQVTVTNEAGLSGSASEQVNVSPNIEGYAVDNIGNGNVSVSWDMLPGALMYRVFIKEIGTPGATGTNVTSNSHTFINMTPGQAYKSMVKAMCPAGASKRSNFTQFTMPASRGQQLSGISPNPNNGQFTVKYYSRLDEQTMVNIFDATGRSVFNQHHSTVKGANEIKVEATFMSPGIYILRMEGPTQKPYIARLLIQ